MASSTNRVLETTRDWAFTNDDLNRLGAADRGTLSAGSISGTTRREGWTLDQLGNWDEYTADSDGSNPWDTDDDRTHSIANELTARTDPSASLTYDDAGNMTDDGLSYKYVWDGFGRLVTVKNRSNTTLAVYRYNGLGYLEEYDTDTNLDGSVNGSDVIFYQCFDERWRVVATFRSTDTYPKEIFVHHAAGFGGYGGSSYIDAIVCRDRDESSSWTSAADATPESRRYVGQSWRADVNVVWDSTGHVVEWMRYTPYGEAVTLPWINADFNRSGGAPDGGDYSAFTTAYSAHSASADMDRSGGTPDSADFTAYDDAWNNGDAPLDGYVGGYSNLTVGYAGYRWRAELSGYQVRHRFYSTELGRFITRDELEEDDIFYMYVADQPLTHLDPSGYCTALFGTAGGCGGTGGTQYPPLPPGSTYIGHQCNGDWVTEPTFPNSASCTQYYTPRLQTLAGVAAGSPCATRLQTEIVACCTTWTGNQTPSGVCAFQSCLNMAQQRAAECANVLDQQWWLQRDCFGQCELISSLWVFSCIGCPGLGPDCLRKAQEGKISCIQNCGPRPANTGYHDASTKYFNDMTQYLANCPAEYVKKKFKGWLKKKLGIPNPHLKDIINSSRLDEGEIAEF